MGEKKWTFFTNFFTEKLETLNQCSQHVHIIIPKNSGGKEEEMKEKNAKSRLIVQIQTHWAQ
jgi:hypothetical protein